MAITESTDALRERVREAGSRAAIDPWAFTPEGLDWRWISGNDAELHLDRVRRSLRKELGEVEGVTWAYPSSPRIATLLLDVALLSLGASVSVRSPGTGGDEEPAARIEVADGAEDRVESGWSFRRRPPEAPPVVPVWRIGAETVASGCGGDDWGPESFDSIASAVAGLGGATREVIVTSADLSRRVERYAFVWALTTGASLVVCRAEEVAAAVGWARPTALWLDSPTVESLEEVLSFAGGASERSKRRALRRLKRVVVLGGAVDTAVEARCSALGLELCRLD